MEPQSEALRDDEVFALTAKGSAELSASGTSLSPAELEILVLVDGRATVAQVLRNAAHGLSADAARAALLRLLRGARIAPAASVRSDAIEPGDLFTLDRAHEVVGSLQQKGYCVRIARRGAHVSAHTPGAERSIVVIDDDADLTKMLRTYFSLEGFAIRVAHNRSEIVATLREPGRPDLVLLDVTLPDTDGFEVLASMRRHPALKEVPVVMLTARATREAVLKGIEGGADGYITKPFEMDVLMAAVNSVLGSDAPTAREADGGTWDKPELGDEEAAYRRRLLERLSRLERLRRDLSLGTAPLPGLTELHRELHTIAGSAGMFGLPAASKAARTAEQFLEPLLGTESAPGGDVWSQLKALLEAVERAAGGS